jgi:hypothetical protein
LPCACLDFFFRAFWPRAWRGRSLSSSREPAPGPLKPPTSRLIAHSPPGKPSGQRRVCVGIGRAGARIRPARARPLHCAPSFIARAGAHLLARLRCSFLASRRPHPLFLVWCGRMERPARRRPPHNGARGTRSPHPSQAPPCDVAPWRCRLGWRRTAGTRGRTRSLRRPPIWREKEAPLFFVYLFSHLIHPPQAPSPHCRSPTPSAWMSWT